MSIPATMRWFENLAVGRFAQAYWSKINLAVLCADPWYGRKLFIQYACTRAGAPHSLEVAGIKAVAECERRANPPSQISGHFSTFYHGNILGSHNPVVDPRFAGFDVPQLITLVRQGDMRRAFDLCELKGVSHKVISLFLRDIAILVGAQPNHWNIRDHYLYCQPIDAWAAIVGPLLATPPAGVLQNLLPSSAYKLSRTQLGHAVSIIHHSLQAGASPLRVSQGIWYFARNVVADEQRLVQIVSTFDPSILQRELDLMAGFLP